MGSVYSLAPDVEKIALKLISRYHPQLDRDMSSEARIGYYFVDPAPVVGGKVVLGTCKKMGSLPAYLYGRSRGSSVEASNEPVFAIVISLAPWAILSESQRAALVDHELHHCGVDAGAIYVAPHDIEEFSEVVRRHGLWQVELQAFVDIAMRARQPGLFEKAISDVGEGVVDVIPGYDDARVIAEHLVGVKI